MSKSHNLTTALGSTPFKKGYQPLREVYVPDQQRGHQPVTSRRAPTSPPSNPPNQGTKGKQDRRGLLRP